MVKVNLTEIVLIKKFHKELRQYLTFFLKVEQMVTKEQPKKRNETVRSKESRVSSDCPNLTVWM